jgi:hypothetical protein
MKKIVLLIVFVIVSIGCSESGDGNAESNNIIGNWSSNCSNSQDISFPNLMGFFTLHGIMELVINETNITATMRTYLDEECTVDEVVLEIFQGNYDIKEKIELENGDIVNKIEISGTFVPVIINLDLNLFYLVDENELYFSDQAAGTPSIDYDFFYFK